MPWRRATESQRFSSVTLGVVAIALTAVAFWLAATKELPFVGGGHEVRLQFADANQIAPDSPVRIAGINVGKVTEVSEGEGSTALVTVELDDEGLPLHSDATAKIRPRTFLEGAFFVDIKPGSPSAPELDEGDTIPVGQTSTPVQLDQVLTELQRPVRDSLRGALGGLSTALDGGGPPALNATWPTLDPLFRKGAQVAEAFTGTEPHDLSRAIASSSRVVTSLARERVRLGALVGSFATLARTFAERQRELAATVRGLDVVMAEAPGGFDSLRAALPEARELVAELRPALRRAPAVIDPAIPMTRQLKLLLERDEFPTLVSLADPTVRSLAGLAPAGTQVAAGLRDPATCLLESALPALKSEAPDGPLSSGQPVYRELLYSLTGLASASQSFDGNGFATRYYAGFDTELLSLAPGNPLAPLFGIGGDPVVGSRPLKPSEPPPLRPDVPCTQSGPIDLTAATGAPDFTSARWATAFTQPPPPSKRAARAIARLQGAGE